MKIYKANRQEFDRRVRVIEVASHAGDMQTRFRDYWLDPRRDLIDHSPDGFNWGYGGSGPAQLALALLADHLGDDELALEHYQAFKWQTIAGLPHEKWSLSGEQIDAALASIDPAHQPPVQPKDVPE